MGGDEFLGGGGQIRVGQALVHGHHLTAHGVFIDQALAVVGMTRLEALCQVFGNQAAPDFPAKKFLTGVAAPQRIPQLPIARRILLCLRDAVHGEGARAFQPPRIICSLVQL